jgi:hypothetical protein
VKPEGNGWINLRQWVLGCLTVYLSLFGIGELLLGGTLRGVLYIAASLACAAAILHALRSENG